MNKHITVFTKMRTQFVASTKASTIEIVPNGKRVPTELFLTTLYEQAHNGLYKNANSICNKVAKASTTAISQNKKGDKICPLFVLVDTARVELASKNHLI